MKTFFFSMFFVLGITIFSSCDSCLQCSYTYLDDITGEETTVSRGTQCSPKKDLKDYEAAIKHIADSLGGVHVCIEQ